MKRTALFLFLLCIVLTVAAVACTSVPEGTETESGTVSAAEPGSRDPADGSAKEPAESLPEETTAAETEPAETEPETTVEPNVVSVTEGRVRVVVYSESLVRVEVSEDGGFEDRPTFAVTGRDSFMGIPAELVTSAEEGDLVYIRTPRYTVELKKDASGVRDVRILASNGNILWTAKDIHNTAECYLPEPYATPNVWCFNDSPRLVKAEDPYTPNGSPNNGWSYQNEAEDYYIFIPMGDAAELRYDFNKLTGACEMIPLKTLGLWYSRYIELSDRRIYQLIETYHKKDFPLDVFVVDTDWRLGGSTGYDVNTDLFRDIEEFYARAASLGVLTVMNDHVRDYSGSMLEEDQLNWFTENLQKKLNQGMSAWWYDRNWSYRLNSPFPGIHGDLLGQDMYYTLTDAVNGNNRTWLLSNVYWIGASNITNTPHVASHRYSLQWTGDILGHRKALRTELEHAVYAGAAAAMPYVLSDIGGHLGDPEPDLYIRWVQYGSLSSIMRFHSFRHDRSPWVKGDTAEEVSRVYIRMRYRLMPLYYSLARDNYDTGLPIMKRLDFVYPQYEESRRNDQYLLGDNILVAPITSDANYVPIPSEWFTTADGAQGLTAAYYNNESLAGDPRVTRVDAAVNFDWGIGSPGYGLGADQYSVRWTATLTNRSEYPIRIAALSDDGIRVKVDGQLVIDNWAASDSVLSENTSFRIEKGQTCELVVEYYEEGGQAKAQLYYCPILTDDGNEQREVFIPDGTWVDVWSGDTFTGPQTVTVGHTLYTSPIFVRSGSFTVLADDADTLSTSDWDKLALDVYPCDGETDYGYELYEDDGTTEAYMEGGYCRTPIRMVQDGRGQLAIRISPAKGGYKTDFDTRTYTLRLHETESFKVSEVQVNGETVDFTRIQKAAAYTEGGLPFTFDTAACDSDVVIVTFTAPVDGTATVVVNPSDTAIIS